MGGTQSTLPSQMSVESPNPARAGEGKARRLTAADPPTKGKFGADNIWDMFTRTVDMYPDNNCFGKRNKMEDGSMGPFEWISYKNVFDQATSFASGVSTLSLPPKAGFGMYTANCMEFQIVTLGMFSRGFTCVPVYDTLGDNIVQYEVRAP